MSRRVRSSPSRGTTVQDDWRAWLPEAKQSLYQTQVRQLESPYTMLSIVLNEAVGLWRAGETGRSSEAVCMTPSLCAMLADPLAGLLRCLAQHAKHHGTVPNAVPLDPANFQSARSQRTAKMNSLLSHVLLSQRTQFLYKIGTLQELIEDLKRDFVRAAEELCVASNCEQPAMWELVDACHYDLNTCLRETIVLLKCFLRAVPDDQLDEFQHALAGRKQNEHETASARQLQMRHRRTASIAGQ